MPRRWRLTKTRTWRCPDRSGPTLSCRPRSSTMPRAAKSGATWGTSTGPARRPLNYCLRLRYPQKADEPAIDRREAKSDQGEAEEILRRERLVEEEGPEQ